MKLFIVVWSHLCLLQAAVSEDVLWRRSCSLTPLMCCVVHLYAVWIRGASGIQSVTLDREVNITLQSGVQNKRPLYLSPCNKLVCSKPTQTNIVLFFCSNKPHAQISVLILSWCYLWRVFFIFYSSNTLCWSQTGVLSHWFYLLSLESRSLLNCCLITKWCFPYTRDKFPHSSF